MRIDDVEDRLRDLREVIVDLEMHSRGKERERFDHPLDVRILALRRLELEAASDLRIALRELRPHSADVCELALVVVEQLLTSHGTLPRRIRRHLLSRTRRSRSAGRCRR